MPWPRSPGFGSYRCDSVPLRHRPSDNLRTCWFPYAFDLKGLKLATTIYSPARFSKRTTQLWTLFLVLLFCNRFLRNSCLWSHAIPYLSSFRHFSHPVKGTFQLSLTVLVHYRSWNVFRVGSRCLPYSRGISNPRYSGTPKLRFVILTGLSPSMVCLSRQLQHPFLSFNRVLTPHLLTDSVCPVPCSIASTNGISFDFSSCGY